MSWTKAADAKAWVEKIETNWSEHISSSIKTSKLEKNFVLPEELPEPVGDNECQVYLWNDTVESAVRKFMQIHPDEKVCILNFASYKNAGGKFINGAMAQEEALCHASGLYPVLKHWESEYADRRNKKLNNGLYFEDFLYCKSVPFASSTGDTHSPLFVDILTYAAPNLFKRGASKEYYEVMPRRMLNALMYPVLEFGATTLFLGAWGCGVFCNDPDYVAKVWDLYVGEIGSKYYHYIVHPIPDSKNYNAFVNNTHSHIVR